MNEERIKEACSKIDHVKYAKDLHGEAINICKTLLAEQKEEIVEMVENDAEGHAQFGNIQAQIALDDIANKIKEMP